MKNITSYNKSVDEMMEEDINWGFCSDNIKKKFVIPVGNLTKQEQEKIISDLLLKFHEDIEEEYFLPVEKNKKTDND